MGSRFKIGKQIELDADPKYAGAPLIGRKELTEIGDATDLNDRGERRWMFLGRRKRDHLWPIVAIILAFIVVVRAPDWPSLPEPYTTHSSAR